MASGITPTDARIERWKQAVRDEWQHEGKAAAWLRWHPKFSEAFGSAREALLEVARPAPGMAVLDVGGGSGEPGFALAKLVGPEGHVTIADLAPGMVEAARTLGREQQLENVDYVQADAHDLPFPDASFDLVTSRFAVMFFADQVRALGEIRRVLKPGGRAAFVAWGPVERNPIITDTFGIVFRYIEPEEAEEGAPGAFKFAEPGTLAAALKAAGFREVVEEMRDASIEWPGPAGELWQFLEDENPPFVEMLQEKLGERLPEVRGEISAALQRYHDGTVLRLPATIVLASAIR